MFEVEKKAYLRNFSVLHKIKEIAIYKGEIYKEDVYFAPISNSNTNIYQDPLFRIRLEDNKMELSFKQKKFKDKTEINDEHTIDISSSDPIELRSFFRHIGFFPFIEKKKKTQLYQIMDKFPFPVAIEHNAIDRLGEFIEIEILLEDEHLIEEAHQIIDKIFHDIGVKEEDFEARYYIDLLMENTQ
jgi:predicted adenylyl cyclase CyaB